MNVNGGTDSSREAIRASLIVLNFDGRDVLPACVESLKKAAGPSDEIIVVDNASTDGSGDLFAKDKAVRTLRLPRNAYIFGLNDGLALARGDFVAFLNNDIVVDENFVENCLAGFVGGDDVFAVCSRIVDLDGKDQGSRTAGFWHRGLIFYRPLAHSESPTDCFFAIGGQSFFNRKMLLEIGSIDPLLWPMYHEDVELSYRAWKRGWRVRYAPDAVTVHRGAHSSNRVFTRSQLRSFVRQNEYLTVWKNVTDGPLLAEHVLLLLPRLGVAAIKRDWPTLVGFSGAVRRFGAVKRARQAARPHMRLRDRDVLTKVSAIT